MLSLWSCKTAVNAPRGTVPRRTELAENTFGGWISVNYLVGVNELTGELIALTPESVYVLTNTGVETVLLQDVNKARLIFYKTDAQRFTSWTAAGGFLSITNGYFFVFSFPLWMITGAVTVNEEAKRVNYIDFPEQPWAEFRKYARFPQGLSAEISLKELEPRLFILSEPERQSPYKSGPGKRSR